VRRIQMFLANGFTLEEARLMFPCLESDPVPLCDRAQALYEAKLADVERRISALQELRERILLHLERGKRR
jgi:DNA-binding transcriptional MerR regulator